MAAIEPKLWHNLLITSPLLKSFLGVMKTSEKQKICPHCEGRVPLEAELCPYCAHELTNLAKPPQGLFQSQSLEESLSSLYKPPYQGKRASQDFTHAKNVENALYKEPSRELSREPSGETPAEAEKERKSSLWPTFMLLLAMNLFVLGLLQLFFATDGVVRLEWDASNWAFYCLAALPLCFFGWKKLRWRFFLILWRKHQKAN